MKAFFERKDNYKLKRRTINEEKKSFQFKKYKRVKNQLFYDSRKGERFESRQREKFG